MPFSFLPRMIYPHLTDVRAEDLTARGVSFLMLDFDNTIVPYTTSEPTPEMAAWLGAMQASGIGLCVVSNSRKPRVVTFCEKYGLDCITHAKKALFARHPRVSGALFTGTGPLRARGRSDLHGRTGRKLRGGAVDPDLGNS